MMFFKSALTLSALLVLASAMSFERNIALEQELSQVVETVKAQVPAFHVSNSDCEKEDEDDCKEFCGLSDQTSTCAAKGNKITCYCKGGKAPDSNCEERCLLCMPDKSALEEASALFKKGGSRIDEL